MKLSWYVLNTHHPSDVKHLRSRVKYCVRKINEYCLRFVCYQNGDTVAELIPRPTYAEDDLGYFLEMRECSQLFRTIYRQLFYLQRMGLFIVTPASMAAIDAKVVDAQTILLGVPVIDYEKAIELR